MSRCFIWFVVFLAYTYFGSAAEGPPDRPVMKRYRRRWHLDDGLLPGADGLAQPAARRKLSGRCCGSWPPRRPDPILGVLAVMGLYLKEEPDELERAIQVEAMLWGLGVCWASRPSGAS
jgi:hypothetical protein